LREVLFHEEEYRYIGELLTANIAAAHSKRRCALATAERRRTGSDGFVVWHSHGRESPLGTFNNLISFYVGGLVTETRRYLVLPALSTPAVEYGAALNEPTFASEPIYECRRFCFRLPSKSHFADRANGCVLAALGGDMARRGERVRSGVTSHVRTALERIADLLRAVATELTIYNLFSSPSSAFASLRSGASKPSVNQS
jgi:hypothetical protein